MWIKTKLKTFQLTEKGPIDIVYANKGTFKKNKVGNSMCHNSVEFAEYCLPSPDLESYIENGTCFVREKIFRNK